MPAQDEAVVRHSAPRRVPAWLWITLASAAIMAGVLFVTLATRDVQEDEPRLITGLWAAPANGAQRVYYLMEEKRARRGYFDVDLMYSYYMPYSIFTLHSRNARDGAAPSSTLVARIEGGTADPGKMRLSMHLIEQPEILGPQGDVLWLWSEGGLVARKLATLEPAWTSAALQQHNPSLAPLPTDRKYYKVLAPLQALVFKGSDAAYYQVDAATGEIRPLDSGQLAALSPEYNKTADNAFAFLPQAGASLRGISEGYLLWTSLLDHDAANWFGLLALDEKAPEYWKDPRYDFGPTGEVVRQLHRAPFTTEKSIIHDSVVKLDLSAVSKISDERFVMGGFLRRPQVDRVWSVEKSAHAAKTDSAVSATSAVAAIEKAFLILHRKSIGADSPWHLSCVGHDGVVHWTRSTGLAELQHLSDGQGAVLFTGYADRHQPTAKRTDTLVFIDEATGQSRTLNMITNELTDSR